MTSLLSITLPYDNFSRDQIAGLFTPTHLIFVIFFVIFTVLALYLSRNMSAKTERRFRLAIAIAVTTMETTQIIIRTYKGMGIETWIPLYFCSVFIISSWISLIPIEAIAICGKAYMSMAGCLAAVIFAVYPSTSLTFFPAWHPASIYSYIYHFLMLYAGVLLIWKGGYIPKLRHSINFFVLMCIYCVPALIINNLYGCNFMFLSHPEGIWGIQQLAESMPVLYVILAVVAQSFVIFIGNYGIYKLVLHAKSKRSQNIKSEKV